MSRTDRRPDGQSGPSARLALAKAMQVKMSPRPLIHTPVSGATVHSIVVRLVFI